MDPQVTLDTLQQALGYLFADPQLLLQALTHRSWVEEQFPGGAAPAHLSQQRMEFLGDALLTWVVTEWLYRELPTANEGELTRIRTLYTNGDWLTERSQQMGIPLAVRCGRGEEAHRATNRRLANDTLEAIVGAILLDGGAEAARGVIRRWLPTRPEPGDGEAPIIRFNEWYQHRFHASPPQPAYNVTGPEHSPSWVARLTVPGFPVCEGQGPNKSAAKRDACQKFMRLREG